jgi:hypothetical protein
MKLAAETIEQPDDDHAVVEENRLMTDHEMATEIKVPISTFRYHVSIGQGPPLMKFGRYKRGLRSTFLKWCHERQSQ